MEGLTLTKMIHVNNVHSFNKVSTCLEKENKTNKYHPTSKFTNIYINHVIVHWWHLPPIKPILHSSVNLSLIKGFAIHFGIIGSFVFTKYWNMIHVLSEEKGIKIPIMVAQFVVQHFTLQKLIKNNV